MRHAFLIIAHNEFILLHSLIKLLDYTDNFIYVHIDRKSKIECNEIKGDVQHSRLNVYKEIDISWGDESQAKCEFFLLEKALADECDYYHFLSGVDLPLKTNKYIHEFFEKNKGKEFIHFDAKAISKQTLWRVEKYHFFSKKLKNNNKIIRKILFKLDNYITIIQVVLGLHRSLPFESIQKGCNWCSISKEFAIYSLEQKHKITTMLKHSINGDELVFQTICVNSGFVDKLYSQDFNNDYKACVRFIKWDKNNKKYPKTFNEEDFKILQKSECLFARKFSMITNKTFTQKWVDYIASKNEV